MGEFSRNLNNLCFQNNADLILQSKVENEITSWPSTMIIRIMLLAPWQAPDVHQWVSWLIAKAPSVFVYEMIEHPA